MEIIKEIQAVIKSAPKAKRAEMEKIAQRNLADNQHTISPRHKWVTVENVMEDFYRAGLIESPIEIIKNTSLDEVTVANDLNKSDSVLRIMNKLGVSLIIIKIKDEYDSFIFKCQQTNLGLNVMAKINESVAYHADGFYSNLITVEELMCITAGVKNDLH